MKRLIIALAFFAAAPSQAEETDLPLWYKEKALLKSYNSLVTKANLRRNIIVRLCECDPSDANIALAKGSPELSEAMEFSDIPAQYQDYDDNPLAEEKRKIGDEQNHYLRLLLECQRAKIKSEG